MRVDLTKEQIDFLLLFLNLRILVGHKSPHFDLACELVRIFNVAKEEGN